VSVLVQKTGRLHVNNGFTKIFKQIRKEICNLYSIPRLSFENQCYRFLTWIVIINKFYVKNLATLTKRRQCIQVTGCEKFTFLYYMYNAMRTTRHEVHENAARERDPNGGLL